MEITSRDNKLIKYYCKLMSDKRFRKEENAFCLEGVTLIQDAIMTGVKPEKIFATENCLQKYNEHIGDLLKFYDIITVVDSVAEKMTDVKTSQGLFAIVKALDKTFDADTMVKNGGHYIGLCSVQDPGNLGTMIRTADAFGIEGVILYDTCDIYSPKAVRATMGSLFRINFSRCDDLSALLMRVNQLGGNTYATVVNGQAAPVTDYDFSSFSLVLIGNEANGLPEEIINDCGNSITIPMKGNAESLNAAVAASVCMWEMTRRR